jgi:hypothetical protein
MILIARTARATLAMLFVMFVYPLVVFFMFSKSTRVAQFIDRLDVIEPFLVRHGISGNWLGLGIVLLLICWFLTWKHPEDEGRCGCTDPDKSASLQAKIQELLRKWEPTGPPN